MFGVSGTNGGARGWAASPAAPQMHGMLLSDDRGFNKKAAARWAAAEQRLSQLSALLGAAIFLLSWRYLSHFTETTGQVELRQAQAALKDTDVTYIRNKVELVKAHAQQLLDSVLSNPNVTVTHIQKLSEEDKALLRRRMETADAVLDKLAKHESAEAPLTFEGYQQLLAMLTDADTVADAHPELQAAKAELPHFKAALERSSADAYHQLQVGDAPKQLAAIQAKREAQRKRFEQQFQQTLRKAEAKGQDYVSDLPEYCVKETHGETVMVTAGLAAVLTNVATAYVALSVSLRLPIGPKAA